MDERAAAIVAAIDPSIGPEPLPLDDDAARLPARPRLLAVLTLKVAVVAYAVWFATVERDPVTLDGLFWLLVAVGWLASARRTLRDLRATA
jgi:hypothetical protein